MEIFVTGATGLVGNALTKKLLENGAQVKALVRSPKKAKKLGLSHPRLTLIQGDLSDKKLLEKSMQGSKKVYHLAALAGVWAPGNEFYDINVKGTQHVMDAALSKGVERVVVTSTAGVIGPEVNGPVNENTQRVVPFFNEYERTKAEAKELAFSYQAKGLEVVATAPTRVYGPGPLCESNVTTKMIKQYISRNVFFRPGDGLTTGNYVYLPDVVDGHIKAMKKGKSGEFYLLGGDDMNWNELLSHVGNSIEKHLPLVPIPIKFFMTIAKAQEFAADNFGRPPMMTPEWVRRFDHNWKVSSRKAVEELGYQITPPETAIKETVAWLKSKEQPYRRPSYTSRISLAIRSIQ